MSRAEDRGARYGAPARSDEGCGEEPTSAVNRALSVQSVLECHLAPGGCAAADERERTRLINDLTRLIRESTVPEGARLAGLTLIGWLARRREDEAPHAIGIEEARESERRLRTTRMKTR